ncbi:MAG: hypothetical protein HC773_05625 [Scytonema sp. CRU_2_7]|nr:hypothetical protein [Scytonema sp. CRU_2_7]
MPNLTRTLHDPDWNLSNPFSQIHHYRRMLQLPSLTPMMRQEFTEKLQFWEAQVQIRRGAKR